MNRFKRLARIAVSSLFVSNYLAAQPESREADRQPYLREYQRAQDYLARPERARQEAIARFEAVKKLDPNAPENLEADYRMAVMWLSDLNPARGERPDYSRFREKVWDMLKAYPDRTNDIRIVYLRHVLENDVLPAMKVEEEKRPRLSDAECEACVQRQLDFLAEGKDKVVSPPDCNLRLSFLTDGALCRLVNIYSRNVYASGSDIAGRKDAKVAALDRLIDRLKKDPRTAVFVPDIERDRQRAIDFAEQCTLHPNSPEPPDPPLPPQIPLHDTQARHVTVTRMLIAAGGVLLLSGIVLLVKRQRRLGYVLAILGILLGLAGWIVHRPNSLSLRLEIAEPSGISRFDEPVTSGVPLHRGMISDVGRLALLDSSGNPMPCQFTSQSRWPDQTLKWVLLDFQTTVPSNGIARYTLQDSGRSPPHPEKVTVSAGRIAPAGDDGADVAHSPVGTSPEGVLIDTGPLRIGIATNLPGLIHSVLVNGSVTVSPTNPVQVELADESNVLYHASVPTSVTVEHSGPMRGTVLVQGTLVAADGSTIFGGKVGYDLRITGYAGKPYARLALTLKNHGWYGYRNEKRPRQWLRLRWFDLNIPVPDPHPDEPRRARLPQGWMRLSKEGVRLSQWIKYPARDERGMQDAGFTPRTSHERSMLTMLPRSTPYYMLQRIGSLTVADGEAAEGWCDLAAANDRLLGVAFRRFWQNAPKAFSAKRDRLTIELWPEGGFWPRTQHAGETGTYQLEGGREKTAEMILAFGPDGPRTARLVTALNAPLIAEPLPDWFRATQAVWPMASGNLTAKDPELAEAFHRFDRLQRAKVHQEDGDPAGNLAPGIPDVWGKVSIPSLRARCPSVFYGWMNYGDLVWSHGYCSLFYDWPYQMLLHHLRLRDRAMFDLAEDMCRHRYDIDQYHVGNTAHWLAYFQRYEKGEHGNLERQPSNTRRWEHNTAPSHTWNRGLLLHWALTGDPRSLQAARENGEAFRRHFFDQHKLGEKEKLMWREFRSPGWAIENWLALFEYTGDAKYLDWANQIFTKTLLAMETENGSQGHILKGGRQGAQFTGYIIEPVCRLHHLTGRRDVADFLKRVLEWQRDKGTTGGTMDHEIHRPIAFFEDWDLGEQGSRVGVGVSFDFMFADGYAYLYRVFGHSRDLEFARRLFRDSVFYYGSAPGALPTVRTPLGYHYLADPLGMATKLHAWSGRYHQLYMSIEEDSGIARADENTSGTASRPSALIEAWKPDPQTEDQMNTNIGDEAETEEPTAKPMPMPAQVLEDPLEDAP